MQKHNYHTHTKYSDGKNTPEEMIQAALNLGFTSLGFSDHSYSKKEDYYSIRLGETENYKAEIRSLAEKYADRIRIYTGIELDGESEVPSLGEYDFIVSSIHEMIRHGENYPIDSGEEQQLQLVERLFDGSYVKFAKAYYNNLTEHVARNKTDIVGHIDLPTKYSRCPEDDPEYIKASIEAVHNIAAYCPTFEMNTGAIARGVKKIPYPAPFIIDEIKKAGGRIIINSDCHNCQYLTCFFDECEKILEAHGFVKKENQDLNDKIGGLDMWY